MSLDGELKVELKTQGADFVYFVDVSQLSTDQNKRYPTAILVGVTLTPDCIQTMIHYNHIGNDEYHQKVDNADRMADFTASYLMARGYSAYSQSEGHIYSTGFYDEKTKSTPLPHKTIAGLAGLGWIGKHSLLVTPEFGSAILMCTVLTDAPLKTILHSPMASRCGNCRVCKDACLTSAIEGNTWSVETLRDELVDVRKCTTCLKCLLLCPWTQAYVRKNMEGKASTSSFG